VDSRTSQPVERILARFPGVAVPAVYAVPDPRTGDRVMATLQLVEGAHFDADAFAAFLRAAPDLGTKWAPTFVRVTRDLPVTATRKVDKPALRGALWSGPDLVLVREGDRYVELTDERRRAVEAELAAHGRSNLLT
jgi:fatty-acyl-CoA synthase